MGSETLFFDFRRKHVNPFRFSSFTFTPLSPSLASRSPSLIQGPDAKGEPGRGKIKFACSHALLMIDLRKKEKFILSERRAGSQVKGDGKIVMRAAIGPEAFQAAGLRRRDIWFVQERGGVIETTYCMYIYTSDAVEEGKQSSTLEARNARQCKSLCEGTGTTYFQRYLHICSYCGFGLSGSHQPQRSAVTSTTSFTVIAIDVHYSTGPQSLPRHLIPQYQA